MYEPSTIDSPKLDSPPPTSVPEDLMRELDKIPREHWPNLLQMIRLFRDSVTLKPASQQDAWSKAMNELEKTDPMEHSRCSRQSDPVLGGVGRRTGTNRDMGISPSGSR